MKALLLSAYDAQSHRCWRTNLKAMFPDIDWTELTLPARYFPWRVRGNSLTWAFNHRATLTDNYDLLLCTSMTDLSALRGFVPALGRLPTVVYFHENQFAYPDNPDPAATRTNPVEAQMLSLYTALCADRVVFNSGYNRESFLVGVSRLLKRLPDHVPPGLLQQLGTSMVLPVPLEDALFAPDPAPRNAVLTLVWNHRWEYDKGPTLLHAIVHGLVKAGCRFRLHLLGQRFRDIPPAFASIEALLRDHDALGHLGYVESREAYLDLLRTADVVLSTADHDFQGLSLLEAAALGCTPLAPARLVYPEYLPPACLYTGSGPLESQADAAVRRLLQWAEDKSRGTPLPDVDVRRFSQRELLPDYRGLIADTLASNTCLSP